METNKITETTCKTIKFDVVNQNINNNVINVMLKNIMPKNFVTKTLSPLINNKTNTDDNIVYDSCDLCNTYLLEIYRCDCCYEIIDDTKFYPMCEQYLCKKCFNNGY